MFVYIEPASAISLTYVLLNLRNVTMKFEFQETQRLMQEPVPGISAVPDDQNARYFHVVVAGKLHRNFKFLVLHTRLFKKTKISTITYCSSHSNINHGFPQDLLATFTTNHSFSLWLKSAKIGAKSLHSL